MPLTKKQLKSLEGYVRIAAQDERAAFVEVWKNDSSFFKFVIDADVIVGPLSEGQMNVLCNALNDVRSMQDTYYRTV